MENILQNKYNGNLKSKFRNFNGKSLICLQVSKRNLSIPVAMISVKKLFTTFLLQLFLSREKTYSLLYTTAIITQIYRKINIYFKVTIYI